MTQPLLSHFSAVIASILVTRAKVSLSVFMTFPPFYLVQLQLIISVQTQTSNLAMLFALGIASNSPNRLLGSVLDYLNNAIKTKNPAIFIEGFNLTTQS